MTGKVARINKYIKILMKKWKNKERKEYKIKFINKYLRNEESKERMHERIYVALFNFALRGSIGARGSSKGINLTRLKKKDFRY